MSNKSYALKAKQRHDLGKGASRRLRRLANLIPGIVYGGVEAPLAVSLAHNEVLRALEDEGIYSHLLNLNIDGQDQTVVLKDMQRHPYKPRILHMDFQRISATELLNLHVPLHFIGEANCPGVKAGGVVTHQLIEIEVRCLPKDLPEFLEVDLSQASIDSVIHLSEIRLPSGVEIVDLIHHNDRSVVSIHRPRAVAEEAAVTVAAAEPAATTTPAGAAATPAAKAKKPAEKGKEK